MDKHRRHDPRPGQSSDLVREQLTFADNSVAVALYGQNNSHLRIIERQLGLSLHARGNELSLIGSKDSVELAHRLIEQLRTMQQQGRTVTTDDVVRGLQMIRHDKDAAVSEVLRDAVVVASRSRPVIPKSVAQQRYLDAIRSEDVVFGNVVLFSEVGIYTFTATNQTCPAEGCCPIIIEPGVNCCPEDLCVPFTIQKRKKK